MKLQIRLEKAFKIGLIGLLVILNFLSCQKKEEDEATDTDISELGQQVGDTMASIDESAGSSGSFANLKIDQLKNNLDNDIFQNQNTLNAQVQATQKTFARLAPQELEQKNMFISKSYAASCGVSTFGSCTNNVITRTFNGCTVGNSVFTATFDGTVTLNFSDAAVNNTCLMASAGHYIARTPDFTVTGRRGATLAVTKTGSVGQKVEYVSAGQYSFTNDGIRRKFTTSSGTTLFDFTTQTTSAITVTGASRSSRVLSGGTLRVTNNETLVTCDVSPNTVTWNTATCNCPVSGAWNGSCSDGKSVTVNILSCGQSQITIDGTTETFNFDRCISQ